MPSGVPVACMAIGKAGATNAALFAVEVLAINDKKLQGKLKDYKKELMVSVLKQC
jgi:phosphoribosylcarboxyaminoimidazole (NCAIR) mutase